MGSSLGKSIVFCFFIVLFAVGCNSSGGDSPNEMDKEAPSVPANLSIQSFQPENTVQIKWTDSTDNIGVEGYKIYRNGAYIASSGTNSYLDSSVTTGDQYCYAVSAFDGSGNESATSSPVCANTSNGKIKWSFKTDFTISGSLALSSDGTVYGKDERYLYAINPDGSLKWKYSPGDMIISDSSPVIAHDGSICLKTEFFLYVVKPDGTLKWKIETSKHRYYTGYSGYVAAGLDGTIYTVSSDSIKAMNADGTEKWQVFGMYSNMTLDEEGLIYTPGYSVGVLSPDGTPKGQIGPVITSGYQSSSSPVIGSRGEVLVFVFDNPAHGLPDFYSLHAFKADGTKLWSNNTDNIFGPPVIGGGGTIYVCTHGNGGTLVCAMNPDGTMKWKSEENAYFMPSLAVDDAGIVYVMSGEYLNAIADGGKLKWKSRVGASYASPAIAEDGTIFVGSESSINAITSDSPGLASGVWSRSLGDNSNSRSVMKIKTDSEPPSTPLNVTATAIASSMIQIDWDASTDALNLVSGYKVFRNGEYIGLKGRGFTDTGLNHSTSYCYRISAVDSAGNESEKSVEVCAYPQQPAEGVLKWKRRTYLASLPALGKDGSLVMWAGYCRFAINPDGTEKWSYQTGNIDSSPLSLGSDGAIYSSIVYAFDPQGNEKWSYDEPSAFQNPSISKNGTLYVAGFSAFWAINTDGSLKWKYEETNSGGYYISFRDSSIASDGTVYASSNDNMIYAFNPDGSVKWKYQMTDFDLVDDYIAIGPDGTVFTTAYTHGILAINPDGTLKWQKNSFDGMTIDKVVVGEDGTIYSSGSRNYVYAFSSDGQIKWKYSDSETVYFGSTLIGADGVLYVGTYEGFILAINHDGTLKWKYKAGAGSAEPYSITSDGTLYFGSNGESVYPGYLYAIQTSSMGLATGGWPKIHHDNQNTGRMP